MVGENQDWDNQDKATKQKQLCQNKQYLNLIKKINNLNLI